MPVTGAGEAWRDVAGLDPMPAPTVWDDPDEVARAVAFRQSIVDRAAAELARRQAMHSDPVALARLQANFAALSSPGARRVRQPLDRKD